MQANQGGATHHRMNNDKWAIAQESRAVLIPKCLVIDDFESKVPVAVPREQPIVSYWQMPSIAPPNISRLISLRNISNFWFSASLSRQNSMKKSCIRSLHITKCCIFSVLCNIVLYCIVVFLTELLYELL